MPQQTIVRCFDYSKPTECCFETSAATSGAFAGGFASSYVRASQLSARLKKAPDDGARTKELGWIQAAFDRTSDELKENPSIR